MSIQSRLAKFKTLSRTKLSSSVVCIIYKGQTFNGLAMSDNQKGEKVSFAESSDDMTHVNFDVSDCDSVPEYGTKISINGVDRLIKTPAKKDAFGVSWIIEHVAYYTEWCDITDAKTVHAVYERVRVRVVNPTEIDYTQFEDGYFSEDEYIVYMRRSAWPLDAIPKIGYTLTFDSDSREPLEVSAVIVQSGDVVMTCRTAGGE